MSEYYISIDVESNGPCPLVHSALQFGAVFYDLDGNPIEEFEANVLEVPGTSPHPKTMDWWAEQEKRTPGIWQSMMENRVPPEAAMQRFTGIVQRTARRLHAAPVAVAYPAGYDFTYFYVYLHRFTGDSCLGFASYDMKGMGANLIQSDFRDSAKRNYPRNWFNPKLKHTHGALDDAKEQGYMFWQMKKEQSKQWEIVNAANQATQAARDYAATSKL